MDLWHALGITRETGLIAAAGCVVAALLLAGAMAFRNSRADRSGGLRLR